VGTSKNLVCNAPVIAGMTRNLQITRRCWIKLSMTLRVFWSPMVLILLMFGFP